MHSYDDYARWNGVFVSESSWESSSNIPAVPLLPPARQQQSLVQNHGQKVNELRDLTT